MKIILRFGRNKIIKMSDNTNSETAFGGPTRPQVESKNTDTDSTTDICPVCTYGDVVDPNDTYLPMIYCDGCVTTNEASSSTSTTSETRCNRVFHLRCINMTEAPSGYWRCPKCVIDGNPVYKNTPVISYIRVSSRRQNEPRYGRHGVETQRSLISKWAAENNMVVKKHVTDVGSAFNVSKCLSLEQTIKDMTSTSRRHVTASNIVVFAADRVSRNVVYATRLINMLHGTGAYFISLTETNSNGEVLTSRDPEFMAKIVAAEDEAKKQSARSKAANARKRKDYEGMVQDMPKFTSPEKRVCFEQ